MKRHLSLEEKLAIIKQVEQGQSVRSVSAVRGHPLTAIPHRDDRG